MDTKSRAQSAKLETVSKAVLKEAIMCGRRPDNLLDLVEKTQDPTELRDLLTGICDCVICSDGTSADPGMEDSGCCFQRRIEFRNWLVHCMKAIDSRSCTPEGNESDCVFGELKEEASSDK